MERHDTDFPDDAPDYAVVCDRGCEEPEGADNRTVAINRATLHRNATDHTVAVIPTREPLEVPELDDLDGIRGGAGDGR